MMRRVLVEGGDGASVMVEVRRALGPVPVLLTLGEYDAGPDEGPRYYPCLVHTRWSRECFLNGAGCRVATTAANLDAAPWMRR